MSVINFGELPESKDSKSINTGGVHIGFVCTGLEWTDAKEEVKEDGKVKTKASAPRLKANFKKENITFAAMIFAPPETAADIKFYGDVYENGVKIRKRTDVEQIEAQFHETFYFFEQLAKAWNAPKEKIDAFKKGIGGDPVGMFKRMFEAFVNTFPAEYYNGKKVNFKTMFNNNDTQKTSFLGLCRQSATNLVFAPYVNDESPILQMSEYEEKNAVRKYNPRAAKAPAGSAAETIGDGGWKPVDTDEGASASSVPSAGGAAEEPLF